MKTIFFRFLTAALCFGVYACTGNNGKAENSAGDEDSVAYEDIYFDDDNAYFVEPDTFVVESDYIDNSASKENIQSDENYAEVEENDEDRSLIKLWVKSIRPHLPKQLDDDLFLEDVEYTGDALILTYLINDQLFERLNKEIAGTCLSFFVADRGDPDVNKIYEFLRKDIYYNSVPIKTDFLSDGVPARKKTFYFSGSIFDELLKDI